MANFLSGAWDFIVWLFPWLLIGIVLLLYLSFVETETGNSQTKKREYLFISITISLIAGLVVPFYLQTSVYWTAPIIFWAGFLILISIGLYSKSNFVWGIFGLGNASVTEYILSFYGEANSGVFFLLRIVFLFFIVYAGINLSQFLSSVTKKETKKKSLTPREIDNAVTDQYDEAKQEESPAPRESGSKKIEEAKVDSERSKGWEKTLKIIASILGIMLLLLQLASQALDVLQKIP